MENLCKKASQNIWALSLLINYLEDSETFLPLLTKFLF